MTRFKKHSKWITLLTTAVLLLLVFGCQQQTPVAPEQFGSDGTGGTSIAFDKTTGSYPQSASGTFSYNFSQNSYQGGFFSVPSGSKIFLPSGALTPPAGTPQGADVTLTMLVEKEKKKGKDQLVFTFGPSGCQFNPPVEVTFDWTDLGIDVASLYYIDANGNYILQNPDHISIQNKKMTLYISHFSRYALGDAP